MKTHPDRFAQNYVFSCLFTIRNFGFIFLFDYLKNVSPHQCKLEAAAFKVIIVIDAGHVCFQDHRCCHSFSQF